jgi:uncharacterized coiled-coil protein SlyX
MNDADRLTRLEEHLTHLQRHVAEQDKVMLALADEVKRLRLELATLRQRIAASEPEDSAPADDPPPHY